MSGATTFSEDQFWKKATNHAKAAGKEVLEKALLLYFAMKRPETPAWAKGTIVAALGYFVMPFDAIPDFMPVVGYTDDLAVLAAALATVAFYINPEVRAQARDKLHDWFPE